MLKSNPLERIEMKQISKHPWLREHWLLLNRGNDWLDPNDYYNLYRFSDLLEYFYSSNNKSVDQGWMKNEENSVPHLTLLNDTKLDNLGLDEEILLECQRILSDRFEDLVELRYNILYNYSIQTATYWLLFEKKRSQTNQKVSTY